MPKTLEQIFASCSTLGEVSNLYLRSQHIDGSYSYARKRVRDLIENDEITAQFGNAEEWYTLKSLRRKYSQKFNVWAEDFSMSVNQLPVQGIETVLPVLMHLFNHLFEKLKLESSANDFLRIVLQSSQLDNPIALHLVQKDEISAEMFFFEVSKVLQSFREFTLDAPITINVFKIPGIPSGGISRKQWKGTFTESLLQSNCIVSVKNSDSLCLARCLVLGKAFVDGMQQKDPKNWKRLCDRRLLFQTNLAKALHEQANMPLQPVNISEISSFQRVLGDYGVVVYARPDPEAIIYQNLRNRARCISLLCHENHYYLITKIGAFFGKSKQCPQCDRYVRRLGKHHRCPDSCFVCRKQDCKPDKKKFYCSHCNTRFNNRDCYVEHLRPRNKDLQTFCQLYFVCRDCGRTVSTVRQRTTGFHVCEEFFCVNCQALCPPDHCCFVKQHTSPPKSDCPMLFADFECNISGEQHEVIGAVVVDQTGKATKFFGKDAGSKFCRWLFTDIHRNHLVIFHNLQAYDANFIMQYLQHNHILPEVILKGLKFLQIYIGGLKMTIRDSLAFMPMALRSMPKTFGFNAEKGQFPFLFAKESNYNYSGPIPDEEFFMVSQMKPAEYESFHKWHLEQRSNPQPWVFWDEMLRYCENDCQVLRQACMNFCSEMVELTGYNPFQESVSLPGFVNLVYRARYMPLDSIQHLSHRELSTYRNYSFESMEWLYYLEILQNKKIRHAKNHPLGEKRIFKYKVDGYEENSKSVFEYHGCYYHACPKCFDPASKSINSTTMATEYRKTLRKETFLKRKGYSYFCIWSCEWQQLKKTTRAQEILSKYKQIPPMNVRSVLYGGRTEAFQLLVQPESGQHIAYVDKNSLYPSVCKNYLYPSGVPAGSGDLTNIANCFGIAHVKVLPPRLLHLPVLPQKIGGKCVFTLCTTCAETNEKSCNHSDNEREFTGVYTTPELELAMARGYRIQQVYEVWNYENKTDLFSKFITSFMTAKVASTGWPDSCQTPEQKQGYLDTLKKKDGIMLQSTDISDNPTRRLLAKLMLNTLWGRLAIQENSPKFEFVRSEKRFSELMYSGQYEIKYVNVLDDDIIQVQSVRKNSDGARDLRSNVVVAAFVTSYARMELYQKMEIVGPERLIYVDTDCVISLEGPGWTPIPTGEYLGEFKSEIGTDKIVLFVCGGAKMYAYKTARGVEVFKAKGITIDRSNLDLFHTDTLRNMVLDPTLFHKVLNPFKIFRLKGSWTVQTRQQEKLFRFTFDKRVILPNYTTLPFGFSAHSI